MTRMNLRFAAAGWSILLAIALLDADASAQSLWQKVDPLGCRPTGSWTEQTVCPSAAACDLAVVTPDFYYSPALVSQLFSFGTFLDMYLACPVPDNSFIQVDLINLVQISGFAPTGSASAARGCVQFTNGFAESCESGMFPFPEGDFTWWSMPIPRNWAQYWNNAYIQVRLKGQSAGGIGASIRDIYAWN
jgi:hypothetical protein